MPGSLHAALRSFSCDARGSASIELAIGAVVLLTTLAACFDLYARIKANTAGTRAAVVMADYVAGSVTPDGSEMTALGEFLHGHELGIPANVVYVLSAFRQPPGDPAPALALLWSVDTIRIGDSAVTAELAGSCPRFIGENHNPALPDGFTVAAGEVLIVAEVCARLTREGSLTGRFIAGDIYRLHAAPVRDPSQPPVEPVFSWASSKMGTGVAYAYSGPASLAAGGATGTPATPMAANGAVG